MDIQSKALHNVRVLDLSRVRAGPTCVRVLADFGADVVRIEPPAGLDPNESMFAAKRAGGDFQNLNRNKRSLSLNLKTDAGRDVLFKLVETADVVVENWRPDVKRRLGIAYADLKKINPRIILASISGFGDDGPYSRRPGFDQIIQGMGGLMSVTGLPGQGPVRAGLAVADSSSGLYAAIGILIALHERKTSGKGQWIQTSLLHSLIAMMDFQPARYLNDGDIPEQAGNNHPTASPMGLFSAKDGLFNLGAAGEGNWRRLCNSLLRTEWLEDPEFVSEKLRVMNRPRLNALLDDVFRGNSVAHWCQLLNQAGVPAGPVYSVPQVFEDPQVKHLGVTCDVVGPNHSLLKLITQPMKLTRTPARITSCAPHCGQHSEEVLREAGFAPSKINELKQAGVI